LKAQTITLIVVVIDFPGVPGGRRAWRRSGLWRSRGTTIKVDITRSADSLRAPHAIGA
jgi:hypothetical protein